MTEHKTPRTWFITGASSGVGRAVTMAALERGDRVAAAARKPDAVADLADRFPGRALAAELDVHDEQAAQLAVARTVEAFGRIDVVVNSAGYGVLGAVEATADAQARAIFDIDIDLGGEEDTVSRQKDLDLIIACHVLEHLYDPPATLARFHAALAPNGLPIRSVRIKEDCRPMTLGLATIKGRTGRKAVNAFKAHCRALISDDHIPGMGPLFGERDSVSVTKLLPRSPSRAAVHSRPARTGVS